ncbi:MAG TPA: DUF362 domain-containing protein [Candidatus Avacidaminococcus intestinavium]|uniref:DUF362 domain-containing protein n=1 Tax=Candidatus Avacidaminococcus intestinavium TaxID=2840684 RepID=A0A9D1MPH2_9FIRM|nr:DUF362 domain-containing protein [Candidatus Avacidaminococcus intestinavium]
MSKKSKVYISYLRSKSAKTNKAAKIRRLFDLAGFADFLELNELTAVKLHVGEDGNDAYVQPTLVREVVERIRQAGAQPFLTDTNTLYSGSRHDAVKHLQTVLKHGFGSEVTGAPFVVADGLHGNNYRYVDVNLERFKQVAIAGDIIDAGSMIVVSHFKGHEMAGFGGAIKNLAMGCAPAIGKKAQHDLCFKVKQEGCVSCGACLSVCPQHAISFDETHKAHIDEKLCIGCGECLTVCPKKTIQIDWATEIEPFLERMVEYAYGAVANKKEKVGYLTLLVDVTPLCDCVPWSDAPIVADIGFLASLDPVAIDQAAFDLVKAAEGIANSALKESLPAGQDKFLHLHNYVDGTKALAYAEKIGMGSREYELIEC